MLLYSQGSFVRHFKIEDRHVGETVYGQNKIGSIDYDPVDSK